MAEPAGEEKSANGVDVTRKGGRRFAEKAASVEEAEGLPLRELSLDAERPKITLQQASPRCAWPSVDLYVCI